MLFKMILKNLSRHKLRSFLTVTGIAVAISAFGFIQTTLDAWYLGVQASASNRIVTRNAVSIIFPLPLAYMEKIRQVPGVSDITISNWFGGIYIEEKNFFAQFAVDPESFLRIYPEYLLTPAEREAFLAERNAVVVGRKIAERFGWKLGDHVKIIGTIYPGDWDFVVRGIYRGEKPSTDESAFVFQWKYLDESLAIDQPYRTGQVGTYMIKIDNPNAAPAICKAVDELFKNSAAETLTETESAFNLSFVSMSGAILTALRVVGIVVVIIILLVLANTMAMSARERMSEYAVLKTLGFGRGTLVKLIGGEALLTAFIGGALGVALIFPMTQSFGKLVASFFMAGFPINTGTLIWSGVSALIVGVTASVYPIVQAVRTPIVDGLRQA